MLLRKYSKMVHVTRNTCCFFYLALLFSSYDGIEPQIKVQVLDVQNDKCLTTISAKEEQSELVYWPWLK